ncbi:MAG: site-specific DNA-methyltransferase, partial [Candidatus Parvarchaeota archaeon]
PKVRQTSWRCGSEYILWAIRDKTQKADYTFNWLGQDEMKNLFFTNIVMGKRRLKHPNQKPIEIIEKLIKVSSNESDIILDPFLGSGSTLEACRNTKRNGIGIEIDPQYIEMTKKRLNWGSVLNDEVVYTYEESGEV